MLYRGEKRGYLLKGDCRLAGFFRGSRRVCGFDWLEAKGRALQVTSPLAGLPLRAASEFTVLETGSGEKSPENPYVLSGTGAASFTRCGPNLANWDGKAWRVQYPSQPSEISCRENTFSLINGGTTTGGNGFYLPVPVKKGQAYWVSGFVFHCVNVRVMRLSNLETLMEIPVSENGSFRLAREAVYDDEFVRFWVDTKTTCTLSEYIHGLGAEPMAYEPYRGEAFTFTPGAPILGLPGAEDEYDWTLGLLKRRTRQMILNGSKSELWLWDPDGKNAPYLKKPDIGAAAKSGGCLSDRFPNQNGTGAPLNTMWSDEKTLGFQISKELLGLPAETPVEVSLRAWREYLSRYPVTVIYEAAVPILEQYSPQKVKSYEGCNTVLTGSGSLSLSYPALV